jgi:isoamylase
VKKTNRNKETNMSQLVQQIGWVNSSKTRTLSQGASFKVARGSCRRLGPSVIDNKGINFAVFSTAEEVSLLLFKNVTDPEPSQIIPMFKTPDETGTGNVFHVFVRHLENGALYNLMANGVRLLDPYAPALSGTPEWNDKVVTIPKCVAYKSRFNWNHDKHPNTPIGKTIIYEVLLSGFTGDESSQCNGMGGTFRGLIQKIPHLLELGITAVELMPICEFDPWDCVNVDPLTGEPLTNQWGYNTLSFFAPMGGGSYWGRLGAQMDEMKEAVRALHTAGIEVYLDMVLNHTREGNHDGPVLSLKGLAKDVYYMMQPDGFHFNDWTGCGNTLNCNHPVVLRMIIDCLRWWVTEYHVDGFRFDLAAVFAVDTDQREKHVKTAVIDAIEGDRVLKKHNVKLIAEPWGTRQYLHGLFTGWSQWNDQIRDIFRKWVKGDERMAGRLSGALSHKGDIIYVTCHDGFTLMDLVSYNEKHNWQNGEKNRDGGNDNHSWNCGFEGSDLLKELSEVESCNIWQLRRQQIKNLLTLLLVAKGTPMLLYGDEAGRTAEGNNNIVFQHKPNLLNWNLLREEENLDLFQFMQGMIALRKRYLLDSDRPFIWHGVKPNQPDWRECSRLLSVTVEPAHSTDARLYMVTNAYWQTLNVELPYPGEGLSWCRLVDTSLPTKQDIVSEEEAPRIDPNNGHGEYLVSARSTVILIALKVGQCWYHP